MWMFRLFQTNSIFCLHFCSGTGKFHGVWRESEDIEYRPTQTIYTFSKFEIKAAPQSTQVRLFVGISTKKRKNPIHNNNIITYKYTPQQSV